MTELLTRTAPSTESSPDASPEGQEGDGRQRHDIKRVPWYAAMLCRVGIHRGKWVYLTEGKCGQLTVCRRCGQTRVRTKHQREWQYIRDGACDQARICKRCGGSTDFRTKHIWGATYSVDADHSAHECTRCGEVQQWYVSYDD